MPQSGAGVGVPAGLNVGAGQIGYLSGGPCVSFEESLHTLMLGDVTGAYGLIDADRCDYHWAAYQREGWIDKLKAAQSQIERDLGRPLCPRELCDEVYHADDEIYLRNRPVAYLGARTWTDWTEEALTLNDPLHPAEGYVELPEAALGEQGVAGLDFGYPGTVLDTYFGEQRLQLPRVNEILGGYRFTWPAHQLVHPQVDSVSEGASDLAAHLIGAVRWRTWSINTGEAVAALAPCACGRCSSELPTYTAALCDAQTGLVCLQRTGGCAGYNGQVRIAYATGGYCDDTGLDPALREAVVLLALVKAQHTPAKPCGCDNSYIDNMLAIEGIAAMDRSIDMRYGLTRAGMQAWRTIKTFQERPRITAPVASAGLLSARPARSIRR